VKGDYATIVDEAISRLQQGLTNEPGALVWGGDWNQAFEGRDYVGTLAGRKVLLALLDTLGLAVTTAALGKHNVRGEHCSIDHIAVPKHPKSHAAKPLIAENDDGVRLSDHDAYVVEVEA
jgi:endonuclease/exonuclease/phosphatase family metal-dependent hydrolase